MCLKPCLHDTTCCQTVDNRLCRVYKHSTGCQTRLTNRLYRVYTAGCQIGCTTRFDNRLYRVNGVLGLPAQAVKNGTPHSIAVRARAPAKLAWCFGQEVGHPQQFRQYDKPQTVDSQGQRI